MVLDSFLFALISYGMMMVIALCVAAIIKGIALFVQRGSKSTAAKSSNQAS